MVDVAEPDTIAETEEAQGLGEAGLACLGGVLSVFINSAFYFLS